MKRKAPMRTAVVDRQNYVDEPVYAKPKPVPALDRAIATVFGRTQPGVILLGYERVRLRWMKPDGKGGLVPR